MHTRFINVLLFSLLIAISTHAAYAQAPVYEPFAVDSVATPLGGPSMLETFLAVNLQKPFMAQVANVTGKVYINAVIEPTGRVSDVTVLRGLRPDCDREALRVMRLLNAWKPAQKGGKHVRQVVTYPVIFRSNKPIQYENGHLVQGLDANFRPIEDNQQGYAQAPVPSYELHTPIDTLTNLPNGALTIFDITKAGKRKETLQIPLLRQQNLPVKDNKPTYQLGHKRKTSDWVGVIYTLRTDGSIVERTPADITKGERITYTESGMVESVSQRDETTTTTQWHSNGLIHTVEATYEGDNKALANRLQLLSAWDSTGRQLVKDGNGRFTNTSLQQSRSDSSKKTLFTEEGPYRDGFKDGQWTGRFADGSYSYTEQYKLGEDVGGVATLPGGKQISYKQAMENPAFVGGQEGMYTFLGQTIRYPADAQRKNVSGKVFVSFVVCTDGSLCDYEIMKGVYPSVDAEALRTAKKMPNWKPGLLRGEPVRVRYNLPVSFQLE